MNPQKFTFLDTETTGLNRFFSSVIQVSVEITDFDLNSVDFFHGESRPPYYFLPNPAALLTNGFSLSSLTDAQTERVMLSDLYTFLWDHNPQIIIAHGASFDYDMISNAYYRNLTSSNIYQMKTDGNQLICSLEISRLIYFLDRNCGIKFHKKNNGDCSFRLEDLARANSIQHAHAHTAKSDVFALKELVKLIRRLSPKSFELALSHSSKKQARDIIFSQAFFLGLINAGTSFALRPLAPIAFNKDQTQLFVADLSKIDINDLPSKESIPSILRSKTLQKRHGFSMFPINKSKIVLSEKYQQFLECDGSKTSFWRKASLIRRDKKLKENYQEASTFISDFFGKNKTVETGIYDGFFSDAERRFISAFNTSPVSELNNVITHYSRILPSKRTISLAMRILAENHPECLSEDKLRSYFDWSSERVYDYPKSGEDEPPWLTHQAAMRELRKLNKKYPSESIKLIELKDYYKKRQNTLDPIIERVVSK